MTPQKQTANQKPQTRKKEMTAMNTTPRTSLARPFWRSAFILIALGLTCFALLPNAQAVSPTPDGGYPGGNTTEGQSALLSLTTGGYNTAVGYYSLKSNTTGGFNTGVGAAALFANTATNNTATGAGALFRNTTGIDNTANGVFALFNNTTGGHNTANGAFALEINTTGVGNTANGLDTLENNTTGNGNTANGVLALQSNTIGDENTANGDSALYSNTTGVNNTANGAGALESNTTGSNNTALGTSAGTDLTTGDNNIDIGYNVVGVAGESNTLRIGNTNITDTFIRGISGATASGGAAVFVNGNGKLGTMTSSARFKDEIKPIGKASEAILALRPVSFRYKKEIDPQRIAQFGLVAEEVEKVTPDLVIRDAEGRPQTVRYEQINAMLLNEFLKEHKKVEEQQGKVEKQQSKIEKQDATIAELKSTVAQQQKGMEILAGQLKEQAAQIQKVSAQVAVTRPAPRTVANDQ
jgi:hypothetical protein